MEITNKPNYEFRVGLFTVIALIMLFWGWSWLKSFSLRPPQRFIVQFHDIAGLNKNAPVQVNGLRVGTVENIELKGKGHILCSLRIPVENTTIPEGSTITIQTLGLVGAKYVEITLPEVKPDQPPPPPIAPGSVVMGVDPVRVELYMNRIAANISNFSDSLAGVKARNSIARAAESSGVAMDNIKVAAAKFNTNMDKLSVATDDLRRGATSANQFFTTGRTTMQNVSGLATDWRDTSRRINRLVDPDSFNSNVKETVQLAKDTALKIQEAVHELNQTLADREMRGDMITMLNRLTESTENINQSMQVVHQLADDQELRADLKETIANAREAMAKADNLLSNPNFVTDARTTMAQLRTASTQVSEMAERINLLLAKKHPFLHLMFSSESGKAKVKVKTKPIDKDGKENGQVQSSVKAEYSEKGPGYALHQSLDEKNNVEAAPAQSTVEQAPQLAPVHDEIK